MSAVQPDDPREDTCNTHYELDVDSSHPRLQQDPRIGLLLLPVELASEHGCRMPCGPQLRQRSSRSSSGCFVRPFDAKRCYTVTSPPNGLGIKNLSLAVPHPTNLPKNLSLSWGPVRS